MTITVDDTEAPRVRDLLDRDGAVDIEQRGGYYRERGYGRYDASSKPLTEEEIARERDELRAYSSDLTLSSGIGAAANSGRIKTYAYADTPTGHPVNPPDDSNGTA